MRCSPGGIPIHIISVFRFRLADALELAEHAVAAPAHTTTLVDGEPAGPALLLVADDDGVRLMSNGLPSPPPTAHQPAACSVRAVFAEHVGHNPPGHSGGDLLVALPLCRPAARLVEDLRAAVSHGRTALVITVVDGKVGLSTVTVPTTFNSPHVD
ncbi:hypothetical protein [Micromonospora sp. NPDC047134]|uniref:hypothetical protein n=1 Tax=Micromonospora sp. NPDC047134 TaxID=3154340 RepID=UPI0033E46E36